MECARDLETTLCSRKERVLRKRVINLVLLGCGGVGCCLLERILATRALHASAELHASQGRIGTNNETSRRCQGLHVAVVAVSDSKGMVLNKGELNDSVLRNVISAKTRHSSLSQLISSVEETDRQYRPASVNEDTLQLLQTWGYSTVVVDCTASEETAKLLGHAAIQGFCIVLANKKPITSTLDIYDQIVSAGRRFRCESTVGAGLPVMSTLTRTLAAGDPIYRIVGALSGTLGYVMSGLQDGRPYSEVVATAKSLGYTEPDPRDDLSGRDVARKALIMARCMGWRINLEDVEVESLYPPEMGPHSMSVEDFLVKGLPVLDKWMDGRIEVARGRISVLRYVATIENKRCMVGFMEVSYDSPLGRLRGSDNLVEIYTDCYRIAPLVIQGAGAGNETTSAGVLADIIDLQDIFKVTDRE